MDQPDSVITSINQINQEPNDGGLNQRKRSVLQSSSTSNTNLNRDASNVSNEPPKASKRPKESRLKQQKLPAWQPILTAKTVLPLFFAVGVVFVVLGGVLLHYSNIVNEFVYDYTDCTNSTSLKCSDVANYNTNCVCTIRFQLDNDFPAPVFIYYGLKNFYQNHRRYVKSRDDNQLLGRDVSTLSSECTPYAFDGGNIAPCGAIANSLFNDTFTFKYYGASTASPATNVGVLDTGIAWTTDKNVKFRNPSSWSGTVKPKNWQRPVYNLSSNPDNNGYQNEDLIVWMRTAALPTFRKLHRRVDHDQTTFKTGLPKGVYTVDISYSKSILYSFPAPVFVFGI